ncbi:DotI/IcmL family type IV secretion protein [Facilibium subflavum]|uniref:DotI/IcmL family type IV secretion protein n=1 Tax=Facilibium subflavum TaxID=2219058 RepID=UPI000E64E2DF|nr:DotI/IcmL family type IV secretion protein [Facilibium subflavum]
MKQDILKQIIEKSHFYKSNFRLMIKVLLLSVILNIILVFTVLNQHAKEKFNFLAINNDGQIKSLQTHNVPRITQEMVVNWVSMNIQKIYSLDFLNYKEEALSFQNLFTDYGWISFNKAFKPVIDKIKDNHIVERAVLNGVPVVTAIGSISGIPSWKLEVPLMISYSKGQSMNTSKVVVKLTVQKNTDTQIRDSWQYFGISQIIQQSVE